MITIREIVTNLNPDGVERFVQAVRQAVSRDAQRHNQSVDDHLTEFGLRGPFRRATNVHALIEEVEDGSWEVDPAAIDLLLSCLRRLNLSVNQLISDDLRSHPWDLFCGGDALLTILGSKLVEGPEMSQYYVSQRDTEAKNALVRFLRERQRLDFDAVEQCPSIETPREEAEAALREYQDRPDLGMIVAFGSPVVDPLTVPVAQAILRNAGLATSPAWFEWPVDPKELGVSDSGEPRIVQRTESRCGVRLKRPVTTASGEEKTFFPRVGRNEALQRFQKGDRGPFEDAGLLMLDTSCRPMLCVLAGHGGCGTQAALQALLDEETISRELAASHAGGSLLGPGRVMQVVEVHCSKRTPRLHVDDLEFGSNDWCAYALRPPRWRPGRQSR